MEMEDAADFLPPDEAREVTSEMNDFKKAKAQFKTVFDAYSVEYKKRKPPPATAPTSDGQALRRRGGRSARSRRSPLSRSRRRRSRLAPSHSQRHALVTEVVGVAGLDSRRVVRPLVAVFACVEAVGNLWA